MKEIVYVSHLVRNRQWKVIKVISQHQNIGPDERWGVCSAGCSNIWTNITRLGGLVRHTAVIAATAAGTNSTGINIFIKISNYAKWNFIPLTRCRKLATLPGIIQVNIWYISIKESYLSQKSFELGWGILCAEKHILIHVHKPPCCTHILCKKSGLVL